MLEKRKNFWDKKILTWERSRYGTFSFLIPQSWSVKMRLRCAERIIKKNIPHTGVILDLGCGTGRIATLMHGHYSSFTGVDISSAAIDAARDRSIPRTEFFEEDVCSFTIPSSDITIMLGLTDWLSPKELSQLLQKLRSLHVLLSFTEKSDAEKWWNPYRWYRRYNDQQANAMKGRSYLYIELLTMLQASGYAVKETIRPIFFDPGRLILAQKKLS